MNDETLRVFKVSIGNKSCYIDSLTDVMTELGTLLAESNDQVIVQGQEVLKEDYEKIPEDFNGW